MAGDVLKPKTADEFVFHYTTLRIAVEHVLPDMQLRMGAFSKVSDPRENKEWNFSVTTSGENVRNDWLIEQQVWTASRNIHQALRMVCLCRDRWSDLVPPPTESRGFGLARMWDRYGDQHRGVCLAFDRDVLSLAVNVAVRGPANLSVERMTRNPNPVWEKEVEYSTLAASNRPEWEIDGDVAAESGVENELMMHVAKFYDRLLFRKSEDWKSEREYRWIHLASKDDPELFIPIGNALRAVILGVDLSEVYDSVFTRNDSQRVPIYRMNWQWGYFHAPHRI